MPWEVRPWLTNPTRDGVTVTMVPAADAELRVRIGRGDALELGVPRGGEVQRASGGSRVDFALRGLEAGEYRYRVECRQGGVWKPFDTHRLLTLRPPEEATTVGIWADGHAVKGWMHASCGDWSHPELENLAETKANLRGRLPDLLLLMGDESHVHCLDCVAGCAHAGRDLGAASAVNESQARARYSVLLDEILQPLIADVPVLLVLGNHDAEWPALAAENKCGYPAGSDESWREGRLAVWPSAHDAYGGDAGGAWFGLEAGNLTLALLDVYRHTPVRPRSARECKRERLPGNCGAEDWSLGDPQREMLATVLAGSPVDFQAVMSHSPLGGATHMQCYHYARASLARLGPWQAGDDTGGTPRGRFPGEEAVVEELMREHSAELRGWGHDHNSLWIERVDRDGAPTGRFYAVFAQPLGNNERGAKWSDLRWYREISDWREEGVPLYDSTQPPKRGSRVRGFSLLRVPPRGSRASARLEFVESHPGGAAGNGRVGMSLEIPPLPASAAPRTPRH